ncbi:MAG: hypothetical protein ACI4YA_00700 [Candidatus Spyradenecus sp.]
MKRLLLLLFAAFGLFAMAQEAPLAERYAPAFYGLPLPETGARVLLILDTSKSMGRKDASRDDGGTRWQTLCDEVRSMAERMTALAAPPRRVPYAVVVLFEGGRTPHTGSVCYDMANPGAADKLVAEVEGRALISGGSFEITFGERLWPLVSRHHITHLFYLGDNDIATHAQAVRAALEPWYALSEKDTAPEHKVLRRQKEVWRAPWRNWRPPNPRQPRLSGQVLLPPPPKEVELSCIAIGQSSPTLKALAELGGGRYILHRPAAKRKRKP